MNNNNQNIIKLIVMLAAALVAGCQSVHKGVSQSDRLNEGEKHENIMDVTPWAEGAMLTKPTRVIVFIGGVYPYVKGVGVNYEEEYYKLVKSDEPALPFKIIIAVNDKEIYNEKLICDYNLSLSGDFEVICKKSILKLCITFPDDEATFERTVDIRKGAYFIIEKSNDNSLSILQFTKPPIFA